MANKEECFSCAYLVRELRMIIPPLKRKDGHYETAVAFSCAARKMPLPTITRYDLPGCRYWMDKRGD